EGGYQARDHGMGAVIGHKPFTVLLRPAGASESERRYTNQPAAYPVGGRKPVTTSAWTERLFVERKPYIGRSAEDIRTVFFDHELILSLGCASVLNVPVVWNGRTLGTINLLHEAGWYDPAAAPGAQTFAAHATPAPCRHPLASRGELRQRAQPETQLGDPDRTVGVEVLPLPVVRLHLEKAVALLTRVLLGHPPREVIVHVEHVRGIGRGELAVAPNDHEVLVVVERGLVAEVVTARDHHAVVGERIDHHHLVVDDGEARVQNLLRPSRRGRLLV